MGLIVGEKLRVVDEILVQTVLNIALIWGDDDAIRLFMVLYERDFIGLIHGVPLGKLVVYELSGVYRIRIGTLLRISLILDNGGYIVTVLRAFLIQNEGTTVGTKVEARKIDCSTVRCAIKIFINFRGCYGTKV